MYNVAQGESSSIPKFSTMPNEGERKPLYRFELNSFYNKKIIIFLDPLVLQGIQ
jgi:hypothetical protein